MDMYHSERTISLWEEDDRKCITLKNQQTGKRYTFILKHSFVVGRVKAYCDLQITEDDRYMSGRHLRFINEGKNVCVEDLNTKNGTKLNKRPVISRVKIRHGDILSMGHSSFEVLIG